MIHPPNGYTFHKQCVSALHDSLRSEVLKKGYNAELSTIKQLYETAWMVEKVSHYIHGIWHVENAHTAASNTKPAAYKTQPPTGQSKTGIGRENTVHYMQTMHTYNAPWPEQKIVQVKDSSTKPSYKQKPLLQLPEREIAVTTWYWITRSGRLNFNLFSSSVIVKTLLNW